MPALTTAAQVDPQLLQATVQALNRAYVTRGMQTAEELVDILLQAFWGGSIERALAHNDRHASFLALRARGDLLVSYPTLQRMLHVVGLRRALRMRGLPRLPELSFSHWAELVRLKNGDKVLPLARSAVAESWSVRTLRDAVAEANGKVTVPPGPLRSLHRGLQRSTRVAKQALADAEALLDDPEEQEAAPVVLAELDELLAHFAELRALLAARTAGDE